MGSVKLTDCIQIVGLFAVVGSLVFVGFQMRQDRQIALAELSQSRMEQFASRWVAGMESDAYLAVYADLYLTNGWDIGDLTKEQAAAAELDGLITWSYFNNVFEGRRHGLVDDEEWAAFEGDVLVNAMLPAHKAVYERWWRQNPSSFTKAIDRILERTIQ